MRALYISELKSSGAAIYKEIKGIVPAKTPVIIECSSKDPAKNKLKIEATSPSSIKDNLLTGVYFGLGMKATSHYNCTAFDAKACVCWASQKMVPWSLTTKILTWQTS